MHFLPLDYLIDELKQNGFVIGVDTYLRVQKLLENMDMQQHYHELNSILCPMFAVDAKQQQLFYQIYDRVFEQHLLTQTQPQAEKKIQAEKTEQTDKNFFRPEFAKFARFFKAFAAVVLLAAMVWAGLQWTGFLEKKQAIIEQEQQQVEENEATINENTEKTDSLTQKQQAQEEEIEQTEQTEPDIPQQNQRPLENERTTVLKKELQQTIEQKQLLDSISREAETQKIKAQILAEQQIRENQHNTKRKLAYAVLFAVLAVILLLELYRLWRRRLIANKKTRQTPAFCVGNLHWRPNARSRQRNLQSDQRFAHTQTESAQKAGH